MFRTLKLEMRSLSPVLRYMKGPGGRLDTNRRMQGLRRSDLFNDDYLALQPLYLVWVVSAGLVLGYSAYNLATNTDVNLTKDPNHVEKDRDRQYSLLNLSGTDYEGLTKAPKYWIMEDDEERE